MSALLAGVLCLAGCDSVPGKSFRDAEQKRLAAEERVRKLEEQVAVEQESNRKLQAQVAGVRNLQGDPMETLIVPVKIELEAMSGGFDTDGKAGDDGIVLYIQPIDRDGHIVKAAGTLEVRLLDLANPSESSEITTCRYDLKQTRELWYGRMWTHHFTTHCPWPSGKSPAHSEVTAVVTFHDALAGQSLRAQAAYKITLPPAPSTAQAK